MRNSRRDALTNTAAPMTEQEQGTGFHACREWDGLVVGPCHPEWSSCTCFYPDTKARFQIAYRFTRLTAVMARIAVMFGLFAFGSLVSIIIRVWVL